MPAGSADTQSAPVRSGTFPPAVRSQWWQLLEEPGRSLCDLPCGQSDWDQDPSALASGEESDQAGVGSDHLAVVAALALAWAWALLQGHEGVGSLAEGPHRVVGHSLEARAALVVEQFLLFQVVHFSPQ